MAGGDEDWERLLELTGAAAQDDARAGAPCVNLQHADTGRKPLLGVLQKQHSLAPELSVVRKGNSWLLIDKHDSNHST